ncbi:hypothetical protein CR513_25467, partial [Mucuna pruriens]
MLVSHVERKGRNNHPLRWIPKRPTSGDSVGYQLQSRADILTGWRLTIENPTGRSGTLGGTLSEEEPNGGLGVAEPRPITWTD